MGNLQSQASDVSLREESRQQPTTSPSPWKLFTSDTSPADNTSLNASLVNDDKPKSTSTAPLDNKVAPTRTGVLMLTGAIFLAGAITAKGLSSLNRAWQARRAEKRWERMFMNANKSSSRHSPFENLKWHHNGKMKGRQDFNHEQAKMVKKEKLQRREEQRIHAQRRRQQPEEEGYNGRQKLHMQEGHKKSKDEGKAVDVKCNNGELSRSSLQPKWDAAVQVEKNKLAKTWKKLWDPNHYGLSKKEIRLKEEILQRTMDMLQQDQRVVGAQEEKKAVTASKPLQVGNVGAMAKEHIVHPHNIASISHDRSLYAAIHPHEDWDWTPADHPRPNKPWKKSRLPPWTVGFTSTPSTTLKAQEVTKQKAVEPQAEEEEESHDDLTLRAAIWPDSDPLHASEVSSIAEEVFSEVSKRKEQSSKNGEEMEKEGRDEVEAEEKHTQEFREGSEVFQQLERHIWALLERSQALEEKLRRYESRQQY